MEFGKKVPDSRQIAEIRNMVIREHYKLMNSLEQYVRDDEDRQLHDSTMKQLSAYGLTIGHNFYAEKFIREVVIDFRHHILKKYNVSCDH